MTSTCSLVSSPELPQFRHACRGAEGDEVAQIFVAVFGYVGGQRLAGRALAQNAVAAGASFKEDLVGLGEFSGVGFDRRASGPVARSFAAESVQVRDIGRNIALRDFAPAVLARPVAPANANDDHAVAESRAVLIAIARPKLRVLPS